MPYVSRGVENRNGKSNGYEGGDGEKRERAKERDDDGKLII